MTSTYHSVRVDMRVIDGTENPWRAIMTATVHPTDPDTDPSTYAPVTAFQMVVVALADELRHRAQLWRVRATRVPAADPGDTFAVVERAREVSRCRGNAAEYSGVARQLPTAYDLQALAARGVPIWSTVVAAEHRMYRVTLNVDTEADQSAALVAAIAADGR